MTARHTAAGVLLICTLLAGATAVRAQPAPAPAAQPAAAAAALPEPQSLSVMQLTLELVRGFTRANGEGSLYAVCRDSVILPNTTANASDALSPTKCDGGDKGIFCCGFAMSAFGDKLPDVCAPSSQCPRTYPGREGAPCGTGRLCDEGMVCCDARPFLGGLTSVMIPTCQQKGSVTDTFGRVFC